MNFFKQSALAFAAWNISSYVTILQMGFAKAAMPETYNWIMDLAGSVAVPAWQFACQFSGVVWEFLNSS